MRSYSFDWVDAFTSTPFGGNGCAVVHDAADLTVEERLQFVRETGLVECAFLVGSDKADYGVRYYLPTREILMAGHPTVATVTSLIHRGIVDPGAGTRFKLEVGAGVIDIAVKPEEGGPMITMTQPRPTFGEHFSAGGLSIVFGLDPQDVVGKPQIVSTGTPFGIAVLRDKAALRRAKLDAEHLKGWLGGLTQEYPGLFEPYLVTLEGATEKGDTFGRLILPPPGPAEDPFTGSATGCMAAYLWRHGLIDSPKFIAQQGHDLGRPGQAQVEVLGPRDAIKGVKVGGQGVVVMEGTLRLP